MRADRQSTIEYFSALSPSAAGTCEVLLIDGIGYLSNLYQYAHIAYIGGGFGAGIHNILEAATFGKPIIFGPKYQKFREANDLVERGGAFSVNNASELADQILFFLDHPGSCQDAGAICREYVNEKKGATENILSAMEKFISI